MKEFFETHTDYETGEIYKVSLGIHYTITEAAEQLETTGNYFRKALVHAGILQSELDGNGEKRRLKLTETHLHKRTGLHCSGMSGNFVVLTPKGMEEAINALRKYAEFIANGPERLAVQCLHLYESHRHKNGLSALSSRMKVCWLADYFPDLSQVQVARIVLIGKGCVSKYLGQRCVSLERARDLRTRDE